jgi:hypothetical protein
VKCQTPGCNRAPVKSSSGAVYAHCDACTRALLRDAFAPVSWHQLARAHRLPTLIVGGTPA